MTLLRTTLTLYWDAAKDAVRAFGRSWMALLFLLVAGIAMTVGQLMLGPTGIVGGLILGLLQCVLIGCYLALLEIALIRKRSVELGDLTENLGTYFNRTLGVGFALSLPGMILGFVSPPLAALWMILTAMALNPAVELLYQGRSDDFMEILRNALSFMSQNWPEWLGAHLPVLAPLAALYSVFSAPTVLAVTLWVLPLYSPHYGFFGIGQIAASLLRSGALGVGVGVTLLCVNHFVMLYRGALFSKLNRSNRRARAWAARAEGR